MPYSFPTFLSYQTLSEDVRMISTLLGAAKKTPVVTPPTLSSCGSVGLSLLVSHWSLAASFLYLYEGAIHRFTIDRALRSAGYTRGPFMAMKSVRQSILGMAAVGGVWSEGGEEMFEPVVC